MIVLFNKRDDPQESSEEKEFVTTGKKNVEVVARKTISNCHLFEHTTGKDEYFLWRKFFSKDQGTIIA